MSHEKRAPIQLDLLFGAEPPVVLSATEEHELMSAIVQFLEDAVRTRIDGRESSVDTQNN